MLGGIWGAEDSYASVVAPQVVIELKWVDGKNHGMRLYSDGRTLAAEGFKQIAINGLNIVGNK